MNIWIFLSISNFICSFYSFNYNFNAFLEIGIFSLWYKVLSVFKVFRVISYYKNLILYIRQYFLIKSFSEKHFFKLLWIIQLIYTFDINRECSITKLFHVTVYVAQTSGTIRSSSCLPIFFLLLFYNLVILIRPGKCFEDNEPDNTFSYIYSHRSRLQSPFIYFVSRFTLTKVSDNKIKQDHINWMLESIRIVFFNDRI